MKKTYLFICASVFSLLALNTNAVNIAVAISDNAFTPSSFNATIGDVVTWTWGGTAMHNVTGTIGAMPGTAASISSGDKTGSGTYSYTIAVSGTYHYGCSHHLPGMVASFTVSAVGILEPATDLLTNFYPNPFTDKITVKYNKIKSIDVLNVIGEKVKSIELTATEGKMEIDFENLPGGVYFFLTYAEGTVVETKKIVKAK